MQINRAGRLFRRDRVALVLLTAMRERADAGATRDEAAEGTDQDRAA
jgi:hypothetical protein